MNQIKFYQNFVSQPGASSCKAKSKLLQINVWFFYQFLITHHSGAKDYGIGSTPRIVLFSQAVFFLGSEHDTRDFCRRVARCTDWLIDFLFQLSYRGVGVKFCSF